MPFRVLFFDLDDTLLDTSNGIQAALAATCAVALARCPELTQTAIRHAYYAVLRDTQNRLEAGALSFATGQELHHYRWREILARCGAPETEAAALGEHDWKHRRQQYRLFPEASEVLPLLSAYRAAVLTNGIGDIQRGKIAAVALERWIPHATISGEVGAWKPQPEIFQHALAHMGCAPSEAVMVGDSYHHDITGAAALGIRTVWINRFGRPHPTELIPDAILPDLRQLPELLAGWERDDGTADARR
jgi:2-haloalkanoic acid dehalogenase type II